MGDLERLILPAITPMHVQDNGEVVIAGEDALRAIALATESSIAVLGVEHFEPQPDGLLVLDYSGYDSNRGSLSWSEYVRSQNETAALWVRERIRTGTGFILTSTSEQEDISLPK